MFGIGQQPAARTRQGGDLQDRGWRDPRPRTMTPGKRQSRHEDSNLEMANSVLISKPWKLAMGVHAQSALLFRYLGNLITPPHILDFLPSHMDSQLLGVLPNPVVMDVNTAERRRKQNRIAQRKRRRSRVLWRELMDPNAK